MSEFIDLLATLKVVGQDALAEAITSLKTYIDRKDNLTKNKADIAVAFVQNKLNNLIGSQDGDADTIINTFNEIKAFLADYDEDDTLKSLITAATTAAQNAANTAESNAKSYADGKVGTEKSRAEGAEGDIEDGVEDLEGIDVMTAAEANKLFENTFYPFILVDLGLPSGTLWADHNVGGRKASDAGFYFQWGDNQGYTAEQIGNGSGKKNFSFANYKYTEDNGLSFTKYNATDNKSTLDAADDGATAGLGIQYVMPTKTQFEELINSQYTKVEWVQVNGVYGRRITSKISGYTDKSIFLPAAGCGNNADLSYSGTNGFYWSSSADIANNKAYNMDFTQSAINVRSNIRKYGYLIRPVGALTIARDFNP